VLIGTAKFGAERKGTTGLLKVDFSGDLQQSGTPAILCIVLD
jgi:hypothetical protein